MRYWLGLIVVFALTSCGAEEAAGEEDKESVTPDEELVNVPPMQTEDCVGHLNVETLQFPYEDTAFHKQGAILSGDDYYYFGFDEIEAYEKDTRYKLIGKFVSRDKPLLLLSLERGGEGYHYLVMINCQDNKAIDWVTVMYDDWTEGIEKDYSTIGLNSIIINKEAYDMEGNMLSASKNFMSIDEDGFYKPEAQ